MNSNRLSLQPFLLRCNQSSVYDKYLPRKRSKRGGYKIFFGNKYSIFTSFTRFVITSAMIPRSFTTCHANVVSPMRESAATKQYV